MPKELYVDFMWAIDYLPTVLVQLREKNNRSSAKATESNVAHASSFIETDRNSSDNCSAKTNVQLYGKYIERKMQLAQTDSVWRRFRIDDVTNQFSSERATDMTNAALRSQERLVDQQNGSLGRLIK